jgi:hypothetical protein
MLCECCCSFMRDHFEIWLDGLFQLDDVLLGELFVRRTALVLSDNEETGVRYIQIGLNQTTQLLAKNKFPLLGIP